MWDDLYGWKYKYANTPTPVRKSPKNEAAALVYKLLLYDSSPVDSMELAYVVDALEVLTYYGNTILVSAGGGNVNHYTLKIGNKDVMAR
jgi:hypothetical protein